MRVVAIDVETRKFERGYMAPKVVCLSMQRDGAEPKIFAGPQVEEVLEQLFRDTIRNEDLIVGHSIAYDFACILATYPSLWYYVWIMYGGNLVTDTAIRERLLDISVGEFKTHVEEDANKKHGYSLAEIAKRKLKIDLEKGEDTWRTRYAELENVPLDQWPKPAIDYSLMDAVTTLSLYKNQQTRAKLFNYPLPTQFDNARADFALRLMSVRGILTDSQRVQTLWDSTISRMTELGILLEQEGLATYKKKSGNLSEFNENELPEIKRSVIEIRKRVEQYHKYPPRTPKGAVKTDADTLAECNYPPFDALIEFVGLQKTASTYLNKMFESPIHAAFWVIGTITERTSCSKPNLQNQPRLPGVRECYIPRAGYDFLACDFSTQEMRTLAQTLLDILGKSRLADFFQKDPDFDPHMAFAKLLARSNPGADLGGLRQRAKTCNFGYPGGMGAPTFVQYAKGYGLTIDLEESKNLKKEWLEQWPEMKDYFSYISNLVGDGNATVTLQRSGFREAGCSFTEACNLHFQNLANKASKRALWEVSRRCHTNENSYLYGSRPVLYIHDEVILETPQGAGHEAALEMEKVMEAAMEEVTPDIPSRAEATLMRYWSKKAKRTFEQGRLIPWNG